MRIIFSSLAAFVLAVASAPSASTTDAREILAKVSDTYANLKTYDFHIEAHAAFESEGVKYETILSQEMAQGDTPDERMGVRNEPFRFSRLDGSDPNAHPHVILIPPVFPYYDFARIAQNLQYAKFLREESLQRNGKAIACYVLEILRRPDPNASPRAAAPAAETVWIDKATYLVFRAEMRIIFPASKTQPALQMDWDVAFNSYTLNGTPPQWLVDGKRVFDREMAALTAKWVGTSAPQFVLRDLQGHEVSLEGLRDKVVLLDFWATWCAPCRAELPFVAALEKTWAAKGLVVLRITDEPPEDVQAFLKRNQQSFPALVNGEDVTKQYGIAGIPTLVVIDKAGKIVAYDAAALGESDLTSRLKRAGLE